MRYKLLILCFFPILAFAQDKVYRVHKNTEDSLILIRYKNSKTINVHDGLVHKTTIPSRDTAFFYNATDGEYEKITTFVKKGGVVTPPKPDLITNIDNVASDSRNKYTGTWQHASATTWLSKFHNVTGSYTFTLGSFLETTFDGYKIEWHTEIKSDKGIAAISIANLVDGNWVYGEEVMLNLYATTTLNNSQLAWTSPTLTNGQHKIKIRYTGEKDKLALVPTIIHDYFKVYKAQ